MKKISALVAAVAIILVVSGQVYAKKDYNLNRIYGNNMYGTSANISNYFGSGKVKNIIVGSWVNKLKGIENIDVDLTGYNLKDTKYEDVNGDGVDEKIDLYEKKNVYSNYKITISNKESGSIIGIFDGEIGTVVDASLYCADFNKEH